MGRGGRLPRPRRGPGGGPLPASGRPGSTGHRAATSCSTRRSSSAGSPGSREERGVTIHERSRVTGVERRAGGVRVETASGASVSADHSSSPRPPIRAGSAGLTSLFVPVYDYALVSDPLTPDQRAVDRLEAAAGDVRREQPVPLLPPDRGRSDPVGRLRRGLLPQQRGRAGVRPPAGDVRDAWPSSSGGRSRSCPVWRSPTAGAARSTRPRGSP